MAYVELTAQPRQIVGKQVRQLRRHGLIPAVLYGREAQPILLQIEEKLLRRTLRQAGGHRLIALRVQGSDVPHPSLVREVQIEPISRRILHADFQRVVMTEKIRTDVPIVLTGDSPVVKSGAGVLVRGLDRVEIEALPGDLIDSIQADLAVLTSLDQAIHVSDLRVNDAVRILSNPSDLVAHLVPAKEEVIAEVVAEAAPEVEVIKRVKEEEVPAEGEEAEAAAPAAGS